jgi:hypothetical protein
MALSESQPRRSLISSAWEACASTPLGFPQLPRSPSQHAVLPTPVNPTGASVGSFPAGAAFPVSQAGRRSRLHFRGLLELHSRYGLQGCSATRGGLRHKAPAQSVTRPSRLSATRLTDNCLRGTLTHWRSAPLRRTEKSGLGKGPSHGDRDSELTLGLRAEPKQRGCQLRQDLTLEFE